MLRGQRPAVRERRGGRSGGFPPQPGVRERGPSVIGLPRGLALASGLLGALAIPVGAVMRFHPNVDGSDLWWHPASSRHPVVPFMPFATSPVSLHRTDDVALTRRIHPN
jgi:hypothetical protein